MVYISGTHTLFLPCSGEAGWPERTLRQPLEGPLHQGTEASSRREPRPANQHVSELFFPQPSLQWLWFREQLSQKKLTARQSSLWIPLRVGEATVEGHKGERLPEQRAARELEPHGSQWQREHRRRRRRLGGPTLCPESEG